MTDIDRDRGERQIPFSAAGKSGMATLTVIPPDESPKKPQTQTKKQKRK